MEISKKKKGTRKPCLTAIVLSLLLVSEVFADATARDLMSLCGMQGPCADAVVGQLAHDNASSILFSNAAGNDTIPVLGVDSSDETVIRTDAGDYLKINIAEDAQRIYSINATSDTAFTITWGDGGTTATQDLVISGSTANADDDSSLFLCGGGSNSAARGACIEIDGNEDGNAGDVTIDGGDTGASDIRLRTNSTSGTIIFNDSSNGVAWSIDDSAGILKNGAAGGDLALSQTGTTVAVQEGTGASACMGTLTANGATPVVVSTSCATTGSRVFLSRTSAETGTVNAWRSALSNGVSFSVTSEAADTGTYDWIIIHEAA